MVLSVTGGATVANRIMPGHVISVGTELIDGEERESRERKQLDNVLGTVYPAAGAASNFIFDTSGGGGPAGIGTGLSE